MKRLPNPSIDVDVDPILAGILGAVIVLGGGAAAYGATRDTEPRTPAPAVAQPADPVVARALKIVSRTDGTVPAADASAAAQEARRAQAASARGRSVDPFPSTKAPSTASSAAPGTATAVATGTASNVPSPKAQASSASAKSDTANAAVQTATGSGATVTTPKVVTGTPASTSTTRAKAARAAAARRRAAAAPAKVTLRIATQQRRTTMNKRALGLLIPSSASSVARVVQVSESNRSVVLRLREGAALTGAQSPGTRCVARRSGSSSCRLVRVHTGRTAVIKAPRTAAGRAGAVTAVRVLSVWRGGAKVAE